MTKAQKFLQMVELYDAHINNKLEELTRLKELTRQITATLKQDVVAHSSGGDRLGDTIAKIVDLENEINDAVDAYVDRRRDALRLLERVDDADEYQVLHKRYFEFKTWEKIACEMNFTYRNVCYIHGKALQTVDKLMEDEEYGQRTV